MPDWYYFVRPTYSGSYRWIAFARRTPFPPDFDVFRNRAEIWFQFGQTPEEARAKLQAELTALPPSRAQRVRSSIRKRGAAWIAIGLIFAAIATARFLT